MIRSLWSLAAALILAGCGREPQPPKEARPDWRDAAIEGIAPLMTPAQVAGALDRGGYVQIPCSSKDGLLVDPLRRGSETSCYLSPRRPFRVYLDFVKLREGRRLATANFRDPSIARASRRASLAASRKHAQALLARFGRPAVVMENPSFRTLYWHRPGGSRTLPDKVHTTVGELQGMNASMVSFWALRHELTAKPPSPGSADVP